MRGRFPEGMNNEPLLCSLASLTWTASSLGEIPGNVVKVSNGPGKRSFCIARSFISAELVLGRLEIGKSIAHFPLEGHLHERRDYEVLNNVGNTALEWIQCNDKILPTGALEGGYCGDGRPSYVARTYHKDEYIPAKFLPYYGCAFFAADGKEMTTSVFRVLCVPSFKC